MAIDADLVQPVETARHAPRVTEAPELLESAAIENVDGLVGAVRGIQTTLRLVRREHN